MEAQISIHGRGVQGIPQLRQGNLRGFIHDVRVLTDFKDLFVHLFFHFAPVLIADVVLDAQRPGVNGEFESASFECF